MSDRDALREVLFRYTDSRPCRLLWGALGDGGDPTDLDPADYVEVTRVTDGEVCLVTSDDEADVYLRWDRSRGRFVYAEFWPPWGVVDAGGADRAAAESLLADRDRPRAVPFAETPFADGGPAADLSDWL
ncbi:MAG: hypothetical protein ABEJ94_05070 [Halorientalis sp.]